VEETREIIYQCNIELTDIMVMLSLHVLTGTYDEGSLKKNESNSEEDEMKMSCSERKSGKIEECWLR